jgi:hypothetical protein
MTLGSLNINTTCDSIGAGTAYPSGAAEFLMGFVLFYVYFYVLYCYSLFVLFRSAIVLFSLLRYSFGIFERFFLELHSFRTL